MRRASLLALTLGTVGALVVAVAPAPALADSPGTTFWFPPSGADYMAANRVIRLAASGTANGRLLGTFETTKLDGSADSFIIRQSTDDGRTWSTLATVQDGETGGTHPWDRAWQPALFEFPTTLGGLPAGTLMLVGNVVDDAVDTTHFQEWRSTDHGVTWNYVGVMQTGGGEGNGIWEPFLTVDGAGRLEMTFSDERQHTTYSQFLGHIVSTDGGSTWSANADGSTRAAPGEVKDVASVDQADRPGMATIAVMGNGTRVMAYETCGPNFGCQAMYKTSTDGGATWGSGPSDLGTLARTNDGWTIAHAPYLAWTPQGGPNGTLLLTAKQAGYKGAVLLANTNGGQGSWGWVIRPFVPGDTDTSTCLANYSGSILPSATGLFARVTAASPGGTFGCQEQTDTANPGLLPYVGDFGTGRDRSWLGFGGCWSVSSGVYSDTCGANGNKAVSGNSAWTDYTMQADVRLASTAGDSMAGINVRVTAPGIGPVAQSDYFAGVTGSAIVFGRHSNNWTQLASSTIPGGLSAGTWYHLTVQALGCTFKIQGLPVGSSAAPTTVDYTDFGCAKTFGAIAVQDYGGTSASWRNISVTPSAAPGASPGTYLAPFASGSSASWSTYGGTWTVNAGVETYAVTSGAGYKATYTPSAAWGDYTVQADVTLTSTASSANAGVLVRASNLAVGTDSLNGYYVGLTATGIVIGKENYGWTPLANASLGGGIVAGKAYHLTVVAKGCVLTATAVAVEDASDSVQASATDCSYSNGAIGVRTYNTSATWRQVSATAI